MSDPDNAAYAWPDIDGLRELLLRPVLDLHGYGYRCPRCAGGLHGTNPPLCKCPMEAS